MIIVAIVGDIHLDFDEVDVNFFNQSDYDLILFVGDLANFQSHLGLSIARLIARIKKPVVFIPGNHDTTNLWQLASEIWQKPLLGRLGEIGQSSRVQALQNALGTAVTRFDKTPESVGSRQVAFAGYSYHHFNLKAQSFDVVGARPFSMGGPTLSFEPYLRRRYGITTLEESAARLRQCVDQTQSGRLIFLAHNGPTGLSQAPTDIWGRDFKAVGGDNGDPDLEEAINYARKQGKKVIAVIAGHMHQRTKSGKRRKWLVEQNDIQYINAACVPRIFEENERELRHHVRLVVGETAVSVEEILIS
jgi:uncharacterized protein (TIGR04168 family)